MSDQSKYTVVGYVSVLPMETGFVMPVFENGGELYIEMTTGDNIEHFILLPDLYKPLFRKSESDQYVIKGRTQKCIYAFKFGDKVFYGDGMKLAEDLKRVVKESNTSPTGLRLINKFIKKYIKSDTLDFIPVLIVDTSPLFGKTWSFLLNKQENFAVVGHCTNINEAVKFAIEKKPGVVLLDMALMSLPNAQGLKLIKKASPGSGVIVTSMHARVQDAKFALRMGARGYLGKSSTIGEITHAITEISKGNKYICNEVKAIISEQHLNENQDAPNVYSLSEREIQVIRFIREGLSAKDIAAQLVVSIKTVQGYQHNILKKLKMKNSVALINFINSQGLDL